MTACAITIRLMDWPEALPLARPIRERVFIEEQGVPRDLEWDHWDESSIHALAFDETMHALGTARLLPDGHIGRMAVLPEWRRKGIGSALARALMTRAAQLGFEVVSLNAQTRAAPFYRQLGFIPRGPVFQEAGIPHIEMTCRLRSPGAQEKNGNSPFP